MREIVLLQSAQADILEIYTRHGEKSYHLIDDALESVRKQPEHAPVYHGHFRRKLVTGAPFGIFYSIAGSRLVISFIMDLRQDPDVIARRLSS